MSVASNPPIQTLASTVSIWSAALQSISVGFQNFCSGRPWRCVPRELTTERKPCLDPALRGLCRCRRILIEPALEELHGDNLYRPPLLRALGLDLLVQVIRD